MTEKKSPMQAAIDFIMGKPEAHQPPPRMNRKQRRRAIALRRKANVKAKRLKHEGRKQ